MTSPKARAESANDRPATSDTIGFRPYVSALAQFLLNKKTVPPLTVSLEGEWGSGKSSFIRQLENDVRALAKRTREPEPLIVPFNAWRHDKDEALWASFALEFERRAAPRGLLRRLTRGLSLQWRRLGRLKWLLVTLAVVGVGVPALLLAIVLLHGLFFSTLSDQPPSELALWLGYVRQYAPTVLASGTAVTLLAVLANAWSALKLLPKLDFKYLSAPNYREKVSFLERFHDDFKHFVKAYLDGRRAFVFVDDLDRCEVPKAAELMQALTLMVDDESPFIVVLAMDRMKIAAGVAARNKELLAFLPSSSATRASDAGRDDERSRGLTYGYEFVEKFIQLPLRVPRLTKDGLSGFLDGLLNTPRPAPVGKAASDGVEDIVDSDSAEVRRVMEMVAPALGFNPRRLKQFLNLFRLRHYVAANTQQLTSGKTLGWTLPQLGKIVAVELCWSSLLDHLLDAPDDLARLCRPPFAAIPGEPPDPLARWAADDPLRALLAFTGEDNPSSYDLTGPSTPYLLGALYGAGKPSPSAATAASPTGP